MYHWVETIIFFQVLGPQTNTIEAFPLGCILEIGKNHPTLVSISVGEILHFKIEYKILVKHIL